MMKWTLMIILQGLPPEYEMSNKIVNSWGEDVTINKVKSFLQQHKVQLSQLNGEHMQSAERSESILYTTPQ